MRSLTLAKVDVSVYSSIYLAQPQGFLDKMPVSQQTRIHQSQQTIEL
jgi:hypothetical protein